MIRIQHAQCLENTIPINIEVVDGHSIYPCLNKEEQIIDARNCLVFSGATDYTFLSAMHFEQERFNLLYSGIELAINIENVQTNIPALSNDALSYQNYIDASLLSILQKNKQYIVLHQTINTNQTHALLNILTDACAQNKTVYINAQLFNTQPMLGDDSHISIRMGINQGLACYETASLAYILELIQHVKCNTYIYNISCAESLALINRAKIYAQYENFTITCGVNIHHLLLTHTDLGYFNTLAKFYPPLRSYSNQAALIDGLMNNSIDYIYSGHSMLSLEQKQQPFADAPSGASSAEIFIPLLFKLAQQHNINLQHVLEKAGIHQLRYIMNNSETKTNTANMLVVFNPNTEYTVDAAMLKSVSKASPFLGYPLQGKIEHIVIGKDIKPILQNI
jgi:hypothetical protein